MHFIYRGVTLGGRKMHFIYVLGYFIKRHEKQNCTLYYISVDFIISICYFIEDGGHYGSRKIDKKCAEAQ